MFFFFSKIDIGREHFRIVKKKFDNFFFLRNHLKVFSVFQMGSCDYFGFGITSLNGKCSIISSSTSISNSISTNISTSKIFSSH